MAPGQPGIILGFSLNLCRKASFLFFSSLDGMQCIPGGFDERRDIPRGAGVKGLDVAMLSSHPVVLGGRHIAQCSSLHSVYSFRRCMHLHCRSRV